MKVKIQDLYLGLCILAGACGGAALCRLICELSLTDVIHYKLFFKPDFPAYIFPVSVLAGTVLGGIGAKRCSPCILPCLLLLPGLVFFSNSFAFAVLGVITTAVIGFQVGRFYPVPEKFFRKKWSVFLIACLFFYSLATGYIYQAKAFSALHFQYNDWAEYAESYLRAPLSLASCGHWNILPTLIGRFLLWLIPAPETLFVLNAFLIALSVPLAANLARVCHLRWRGAVFFACVTAFLPVFTHQYLCSFYGYHPVVYLICLGLLFFTFEARGSRIGMFVCAVLMLFVQETSAILWIGWGLYQAAGKKKYLKGTIIFVIGVIVFLLLSKHSGTSPNYGQAGRYQHLGTSLTEICLSPFLRPEAFLSILLEYHTIYFVAVILLPLIIAVIPRSGALWTVIPMFAGILLQIYSSNKTVASQYGLEITVYLLGLAVSSTGLIRQKKVCLPRWLSISPCRYVSAILCALLFSAVAAHFLWGHSFMIGKWSFWGENVPVGKKIIRRVGNLPDMETVFEQLCRIIPDDARLLASQRIRSRFVFRNRTFPVYSSRLAGDVIVVDLDDIMPNAKLRETLYFSSDVHLINFINYLGTRLLIYRVSPPGVTKRLLPFLCTANKVIGNSGLKIAENQHFDIRLLGSKQGTFLSAMVKQTPVSDAEFVIRFSGKAEKFFVIRFAHGVLPASAARPGQVFLFQLPVKEFDNIHVQINSVL